MLPPDKPETGFIEVVGLTSEENGALTDARLSTEQWQGVLRVSTIVDGPAMLGSYSIRGGSLRFTPAFPFDPGRSYHVRFDPVFLPRSEGRHLEPIVTTVSRAAPNAIPSTVVQSVAPQGAVPENLLRIYIEFSAPMGMRGALEHVSLLDEKGQKVVDPFLPLDYELWNGDRTRYTLFFDPGRVKRDLLPHETMGRSLRAGAQYALVVAPDWRDAGGQPLREAYRRTFRVGPPDEAPIDPAVWRIRPPAAGTHDPLVVTFPEPLDHGLLARALGVARADGTPVHGTSSIPPGETSWQFRPRDSWAPGGHSVVVLSILEDLAGNQIGRAFEVDRFDRTDERAAADSVRLPFRIEASR